MFIVSSYPLAIVFCFITMLCWGSWANTQKLAGKTWRYELFYWDYVIGIVLLSVLFAFTLEASVRTEEVLLRIWLRQTGETSVPLSLEGLCLTLPIS